MERGEAAAEKMDRNEELSREEFTDPCRYLDPLGRSDRRRGATDERARRFRTFAEAAIPRPCT